MHLALMTPILGDALPILRPDPFMAIKKIAVPAHPGFGARVETDMIDTRLYWFTQGSCRVAKPHGKIYDINHF